MDGNKDIRTIMIKILQCTTVLNTAFKSLLVLTSLYLNCGWSM